MGDCIRRNASEGYDSAIQSRLIDLGGLTPGEVNIVKLGLFGNLLFPNPVEDLRVRTAPSP